MKQTTKGKAYISAYGSVLFVDEDIDEDQTEAIRQDLIAEHGVLVSVFDVELENGDWFEVSKRSQEGDGVEAYAIIQEKGRIL